VFLGFCSSAVEVSVLVRIHDVLRQHNGLTLNGCMSNEDSEHTTLQFRSVF
jgi:hypothetical protein